MKSISLLSMSIQNFKGIKNLDISFGDKTEITGMNATGKTSVVDAFNWILFDKNSENSSKFMIRPVDRDGNPIHNIDISVVLTLTVDGKEVVLSRTQREKWTRKRGEAESKLTGSENIYSINEVSQKESEYKTFIASIIDEELFRLITDVRFFASMKPEERRKKLLELCPDVTDEEVFNSDPEKWEIIRSDIEEVGASDAKAREKKRYTAVSKKQAEYPVRIDEASRSIVDVPDTTGLIAKRNDITAEIAEMNIPDVNDVEKRISELDAKRRDLKSKLEDLQYDANTSLREAKEAAIRDYSKRRSEVSEKEFQLQQKNSEVKEIIRLSQQKEAELRSLGEIYKQNENPVPFDESSLVCKYCGQTLPEDRISEIRSLYEKEETEREKRKADALTKGRALKSEITDLKQRSIEMMTQAEVFSGQVESEKQELAKDRESVDEMPERADISDSKEYADICAQIASVGDEMAKEKDNIAIAQKAKNDVFMLENELTYIDNQIKAAESVKERNAEFSKRIEELEEEQRVNGQMLANIERKLILMEEFSVKKSKMLSENINKLFEFARFELFEYQVNGGVREICEISYNGVKYGSLNNGHRIAMGLDIIRTFQRFYGVIAPVWIDNAESINDVNIPEMDGQIITLSVTDDAELKVV